MLEKTKEQKSDEYFYACCLICRTTLIQAKNGLDGFIRCPQCGNFISVKIEDDIVTIKRK